MGETDMERKDNYAIQARQARAYFLSYDQEALQRKLGLNMDTEYLYAVMLCKRYRINRKTAEIQRQEGDSWVWGESFEETMTLLDLVCDSREDRWLSGRWKNMLSFGLQFHRSLLDTSADPVAEAFARDPERFAKACEALGGKRLPQGDIGYSIELFDGLKIGIQLWLGDDEFPSALKYMWDENALMYIKYETMYFARGLLLQRIRELMAK